MASPLPGGRSNDPAGDPHQHVFRRLPHAVPETTPARAPAGDGGDQALPHGIESEDAGSVHGLSAPATCAAFLRPSLLPELPEPRESAMAGTPAEETSAC